MKSREEILTLLQQIQPGLKAQWPIASIALFGSVARNEQTPTSDIDLLIEFVDKIGWDVITLEAELSALLGAKVDIVSRRSLQPYHWQRIGSDIFEVTDHG